MILDEEQRNAEDIAELKRQMYGLPQRIDSLDKTVTQLCTSITSLLIKLEDKYPTKEMCAMCQAAFAKELAAIAKDIADCKIEMEKQGDKIRGLNNWLLAGAAGIIVSLLIFIFSNLDKLFVKVS